MHMSEGEGITDRLAADIINDLRSRLDVANREGRAVIVYHADLFNWLEDKTTTTASETLTVPQWIVVIMLEWLESDPRPAMTIEEWVSAFCSIPVADGPYGLWKMLQATDAKADALAHMAHEFGGKK